MLSYEITSLTGKSTFLNKSFASHFRINNTEISNPMVDFEDFNHFKNGTKRNFYLADFHGNPSTF